MKTFIGSLGVAIVLTSIGTFANAGDDKDAKAIIDKAINAMGGEKNLASAKTATWKGKGKISIGGAENEFTMSSTVQGIDHFRQEFEADFGGNAIKGVTVLNGDKGWRQFAGMTMELAKDEVENEKRTVYLQIIPTTLLPLREKGFKIQKAPEDKVNGKAAAVVKVTPADGKEFTLYFDKESGLPVKMVGKVIDFIGEFDQETTLGGYKDFKGVKRATKIETKRDGQPFMDFEVTEFSVLEKVDPKLFTEPQ